MVFIRPSNKIYEYGLKIQIKVLLIFAITRNLLYSINSNLIFLNSTICGVKCKDGIIMGTEKIITNKMLLAGTDKRLYSIALNAGGVVNGITPDGRAMIQKARDECKSYKDMFHVKIPGVSLADRVALKF